MLIGVAVVVGSVVYSAISLRNLEGQITQKREEVKALEEKINELRETTRRLLPNDFTGKFGILLETDEKLEWAKTNVYEKGKDNGFDPVYIFKDTDGYKTVAVFDSRESAKEKLPLAKKVNPTSEIIDFSVLCSTPKWVDDSGYFDCLKQ